jgi:ubiquitin carboxyl-terminal hydrolase 22/27/51
LPYSYQPFESQWYRFDDDKVTHTSLSAVLASNAYMCFYVKRHLDYKPYQTPTYVLMREKEEQKERERELKEREREAKGGGSMASPRIVGGGGSENKDMEIEDEIWATV